MSDLVSAMAEAVVTSFHGHLRYNQSCKIGYFLLDDRGTVTSRPLVRHRITEIADALPSHAPQLYNAPFRDRIEAEVKRRVSVPRSALRWNGASLVYDARTPEDRP